MIELYSTIGSVEPDASSKMLLAYLHLGMSSSYRQLCTCILKPYTFCRWRLFRKPITAKPENVVIYTKAAIALHNFLRCTKSAVYCPPGFTDGEDDAGNVIEGGWRKDDEPCSSMLSMSSVGSKR